jgi:hypothetical protein
MPENPEAVLSETSTWSETIHRIDPRDHLKGGIDGNLNKATRELANRTRYLKDQLDDVAQTSADAEAALAEQILVLG